MKKTFMFIFILCSVFLICGCGNKKEPSQISCKYTEGAGDFGVAVEMLFKRDNKKELVTLGQLIMSYDLGGTKLSELQTGEYDENSVEGIMGNLFDSVCDNLGTNYEDCEIVETDTGVDVVMTFNLTGLAQTSAGEFHRNMTINQIKQYIQGKNEDVQMVCTTK